MRILHTSDWHLGKNLDGTKNSRLEEQEKFLLEFAEIVEKNDIDMIIIAGDIYDNGNPPAKAEKLFYETLKKVSAQGQRAVLIIAGNHDNPERLIAAAPLASEHGIVMLGTPKSMVEAGRYGSFEVAASGEGWVEIHLKGEKVVIAALPYPSEKRLSEVFIEKESDEERKKSYSEKIGELFQKLSENYREDTINIAASHIYVIGSDRSDSERQIEIGGSLAVEPSALPQKAQYIALGHLHRPQRVKGTTLKAYYAGSPIQYSKSEVGYVKSMYIVDVKAGSEAVVEEVYLSNYKPIEIWKCKSIEEAVEMCKENSDRDIWVYLEVETDEYISQEYIKQMHDYKKDIVEIVPKIRGLDEEEEHTYSVGEKSIGQLFKEFYYAQRGVEPAEEIMELFSELAYEAESDERVVEEE
ncbi:exonuclease SbcCD subunit D [Clostridium thermarum]|uniref:exonuclease SbcCD subunit D n=1 Tax=Clostridium thermarum TaxID=1716543 RepID=UPI0013CF8D39|nr:exonuclease SbcCD subunit D [Clostridium thermarum]